MRLSGLVYALLAAAAHAWWPSWFGTPWYTSRDSTVSGPDNEGTPDNRCNGHDAVAVAVERCAHDRVAVAVERCAVAVERCAHGHPVSRRRVVPGVWRDMAARDLGAPSGRECSRPRRPAAVALL